ncbi:hypothetical protein BV20DRAFT_372246 [Pilatotrama ljubarskyi]|nr:hypothetical protein BV20DRAFT_372246 [Pilatotrama ljubarskyi]
MASSSYHSNMIQFPRLPSVPESWDTSRDEPLLPLARPRNAHDARTLKTSRSSESLTHRKDRVEFLRRREWTRRVATGGDQPSSIPKRARTYSWEDIIAAADAAADSWDYYSAPQLPPRRAPQPQPDTLDDEPYVIYTATPQPRARAHPHASAPGPLRPSAAISAYTPHTPEPLVLYSTSPSSPSHSPAPSPSPTLSPLPGPARGASPPSSFAPGLGFGRRGGWRAGPHSRHSSLSSISEEDEGLARF